MTDFVVKNVFKFSIDRSLKFLAFLTIWDEKSRQSRLGSWIPRSQSVMSEMTEFEINLSSKRVRLFNRALTHLRG